MMKLPESSYNKEIVDAYCEAKDSVERLKREVTYAKKLRRSLQFALSFAEDTLFANEQQLKKARIAELEANANYLHYCSLKAKNETL